MSQSRFQSFVPQTLFEQEEHQLYDFTSERGLLACIKRWPAFVHDAVRVLRDDALNLPANRAVFAVMKHIASLAQTNGWPLAFDRPALLQAASYMGTEWARYFVDSTEGMEQVRWIEAMEPMVTPEGFQQYLHVVVDRAQRVAAYRQARQVMLQVGQVAERTAGQVLGAAATALGDLAQPGASRTAQRVGEGSFASAATGLMPSVLPGFFSMIGGLRPGTLSVVAARTNVGKSALLQAVAVDLAARQRVPVLLLDCEMTRDEVFGRALASLSGCDEGALRQGYTDAAVEEARRALAAAPLFHLRTGGMTSNQIFDEMRQFRRSLGDRHGLIVLDYLKAPADTDARTPEFIVLGRFASDLKEEAGRLGLPIIAGVQENRAALGMDQKRRANGEGLGAVAGSDRITHVCDAVAVLRNITHDEGRRVLEGFGPRADYSGPIEANRLRFNQVLHLCKNRCGRRLEAGLPVYYRMGVNRFEEVGQEEREWLHAGGTTGAVRGRAGLPSVRTMRLAT